MGLKPIAFGACGALAGPKFKVTATRYEPGRPEEIVAEKNDNDTSVDNMAALMEGISREVVIPQQREANSKTGHNTKSAIITGWAPGEFFTGLENVIRKYPLSDEVRNNFGQERDSGYVQQAVHNAYRDSGMSFHDYYSGCRAVAGNPMMQNHKKIKIDEGWRKWITQHVRNYSNGGQKGKASLEELKKFVHDLGKGVVQSLREFSIASANMSAFERMSKFDPNDPTVGNRFSSVAFDQYGRIGKVLIKLPGIRKALADGIRDEIGFPRDKDGNHIHVLCPKVHGVDHDDRPLTNVAGAILNQTFIRNGHMTIDNLKNPYA
jgi:hypothetical protein